MLGRIFGKKKSEEDKQENKNIDLLNPIEGEIIKMTEVPDQVFADKLLGDGFAINPKGNQVHAPIGGEVKVLFPTLHAIAIESKDGLEILIHIGIDTVELNGEGFRAHVKQGDFVEAGQLLITMNQDIIKSKGKSPITPIIVTNMDVVDNISVEYGNMNIKDKVAVVTKK